MYTYICLNPASDTIMYNEYSSKHIDTLNIIQSLPRKAFASADCVQRDR